MGETRFPPWLIVAQGKLPSARGGRLRRPGAPTDVCIVLNPRRGLMGKPGFPHDPENPVSPMP